MAIIVYTSAVADPIGTKEDAIIDLSGAGSLPSNVNIYADAVDTENPGASFSFQWYLLAKPTGSAAVIANNLSASTSLNTVDTWGNYRLFCVARNTSTNEFSESDILIAPNSSFMNVNILSEHAGIQKPAKGERNWYEKANHWADKVEELYEELGGFAGLPVISGITSSVVGLSGDTSYSIQGTPNEVEVLGIESPGMFETVIGLPENVTISSSLTIGSAGSGSLNVSGDLECVGATISTLNVDDVAQFNNEVTLDSDLYIAGTIQSRTAPYSTLSSNGSVWSLSKGGGAASELLTITDVPTTSKRGGVLLETAGLNTNGVLPGRDWVTFSDSVTGTSHIINGQNTWTTSPYIETYNPAWLSQWCHVVFPIHIPGTFFITKITCTTNGLGNLGGATPDRYGFQFVTSKNPWNNEWTNRSGLESGWTFNNDGANPSYSTQVRSYTFPTPLDVDNTYYLGILVTSQPGIADPAIRLHVTITGYRLVGS
jgi:hypothetical protein